MQLVQAIALCLILVILKNVIALLVNAMETETTETVIQNLFQPKTALGRKLWEIRQKIVASGKPLLGWEEVEKEVTQSRNERSKDSK